MKATTPKQVLIAIKWILQHYDWCQNHFYSSNKGEDASRFSILEGTETLKCCCLDGAYSLVEADDDAANKAYALMRKATGGVVYWNDVQGRTKKQVIAMLNRLIKKA